MNDYKIVDVAAEGEPGEQVIVLDAHPEWRRVNISDKETEVELHSHRSAMVSENDRLVVQDDLTIKIPRDIASKLNWGTGTELWVEVYEEKLGQAIFGPRLRGKAARKALEQLRKMILDQSSD